jgi:hypothetical protein
MVAARSVLTGMLAGPCSSMVTSRRAPSGFGQLRVSRAARLRGR